MTSNVCLFFLFCFSLSTVLQCPVNNASNNFIVSGICYFQQRFLDYPLIRAESSVCCLKCGRRVIDIFIFILAKSS